MHYRKQSWPWRILFLLGMVGFAALLDPSSLAQTPPKTVPSPESRVPSPNPAPETRNSELSAEGNFGRLIIALPDGRSQALETRGLSVRVRVQGRMARTEVEQIFFNPTPRQTEGTFTFQLPQDAAITRLAMEIDGKLMEGEIVERTKARAVYESIVRQMQDPALLEWQSGNRFKTQIFPIPANSTKRIILGYDHVLDGPSGSVDYVYHLARAGAGPQIGQFQFQMTVAGGPSLRVLPYDATVKTDKKRTDIHYQATSFRSQGPLVVRIAYQRQQPILLAGTLQNQEYGLLEIPIRLSGTRKPFRNWVILLDTSAGMKAKGLAQAVEVAKRLLEKLPAHARFGIVAGDLKPRLWQPQLVSISRRSEAERFLSAQIPRGATHLEHLFQAAAKLAPDRTEVIYLGDGLASIGEMDPDLLVARLQQAIGKRLVRFSAVAIGSSPDIGFLQKVARETGGRVEQLLPAVQPQRVADQLQQALTQPQLSQIQLVIGGMSDIVRFQEGNLAHGESLVVAGRMTAKAVRVDLQGKINHKQPYQYKEVVEPATAIENPLAPAFWARFQITRMEREGASHRQVVQLSKTFGVMSRYTSFLVLENDAAYQRYQIARRQKQQQATQEVRVAQQMSNKGAAKTEKDRAKAIKGWLRGQASPPPSGYGANGAVPPPPAQAPASAAPRTDEGVIEEKRSPPLKKLKDGAPSRALRFEQPAEPSPDPTPQATPKPKAHAPQSPPEKAERASPSMYLPSPYRRDKVSLSINSQPSAAAVYIDGKRVGNTPLRLTIPYGKHTVIKVEKQGYSPQQFPWQAHRSTWRTVRLLPDLASARTAVKNKPLDWNARENLYQVLRQQKQLAEALTAIQDWRRYAPEDATLILRETDLLIQANQPEEGRRVLSELVEFAPQDYARRVMYAAQLEREGNITFACDQYAQAVRLNPAQRDTFRTMMELYRRRTSPEFRDIVRECIVRGVSRLPVVRDLSMILFWDHPHSDVDLHIHEPTGDHVYYSRRESSQGGTLYYDITNGYGPEIYVLGTGKKGTYRIAVVYFSGSPSIIQGQLVILRNAGSPQETRQNFPVQLQKRDGRNEILITTIDL